MGVSKSLLVSGAKGGFANFLVRGLKTLFKKLRCKGRRPAGGSVAVRLHVDRVARMYQRANRGCDHEARRCRLCCMLLFVSRTQHYHHHHTHLHLICIILLPCMQTGLCGLSSGNGSRTETNRRSWSSWSLRPIIQILKNRERVCAASFPGSSL